MDKVKNYQAGIQSVLEEYYNLLSSAKTVGNVEVRDELIIDTVHNHFQVVCISWREQQFSYNTVLHIDIIGEKVWIQQNNTELAIADTLIEKGILRSDIVLGFLSPNARQYSGFAIA
jgi:XisI protein